MEVAQHGGERAPGALEDGAPGDGPRDPRGAQGPHASRARPPEGPGAPASRSHGAPGHDEGTEGGPGDFGPQTPSRTEPGAVEGPGDANAGGHEGPQYTRSHEGPGDANAGGREGPQDSGSHEGPGDANAGGHEGPQYTRSHEGPQYSRSHEGPGEPNAGSHEGPHHTRSHEGPQRSSSHEGPGDPNAGSHEGPQHSRSHEGPRRTSTDEGPGDLPSRSHEGPRHARTGGANEGPGDLPSRSHEGPRRKQHEFPGADEGPDVSAEQRNAGTRAAEGPSAPGACGEGPRAPGTGPPSEPHHDDGAPAEQRPGQGPAGDPGSFKKPVAPGRPGGREKGLDPGSQPAGPPRLPDPGGEAAPDVGPGGLPSDAHRAALPLPYREPPWSGPPRALYSLEVLKGGSILATRDLSRASWTVFGRLPACHVPLEHPSVSRYHAVLQHRSHPGDGPDQEPGFYVYDLGSTHGTYLNKQRVPPNTYCRLRVGHVLKFGGSTRLFILQGPEDDQEVESELTVTQIKEARRQRETLQKRMLGDDSDDEDEDDKPSAGGKREQSSAGEEAGCMWGMGEDAIEEENEENPIAMEFQEEREALYLKNPRKALQGFFDREGEELEFEYEEKSPGSWICRVKLPADDSSGKQLVAEVTHSGKKKEAANICALEACRMLEIRGLLRQEAVSRRRKAKKWEDEDFYDSDDDTFLDRTGIVEKKRLNRMKKAGKIEEKPETLQTLTAKLELVEKEILEVAAKLKTSQTGVAQPPAQDSLDAFMTEMRAGSALDSVSRKKLHLQSLELKKEQQRLKSLIKIVQPTELPELRANTATEDAKAKKRTLPMFGAMKGGSKFKLKTGTVGKLPPKRSDLPASLFTMKDTDEPEEEEEDEEMEVEDAGAGCSGDRLAVAETAKHSTKTDPAPGIQTTSRVEKMQRTSPGPERSANTHSLNGQEKPETSPAEMPKPAAERQRKMHGPSKPPRGFLSAQYPEDDPDYCVWTPPAGQSGDGKTHLNEKYGY